MNKIIKMAVILPIVFAFAVGQAKAGFFDWLNGNNRDNPGKNEPIAEGGISADSASDLAGIFQNIQTVISGKKVLKIENPTLEPEPKKEYQPIKTFTVVATGYSSTPDQTDSTPFITAWGTRVRDGIMAANFLPFGTLVRIPSLFGEKIFVIEDRMNKRYKYNIDVWFSERELAKVFGVKKVTIEIVEES